MSFEMAYGAIFVLLMVLAVRRTLLSETSYRRKALGQMAVFYGFYLFWLLAAHQIWRVWSGMQTLTEALPLLALSVLAVYCRFIEPNLLAMRYRTIPLVADHRLEQPLRIALIADMHVGLFSGGRFQLQRIVKKINREKVDAVLIAGDWTYEPGPHLQSKLYPLSLLDAPAYSVPGNHDEELPGPPIQEELKQCLVALGIRPIEHHWEEWHSVYVLGTGDLWAGKADLHQLQELPSDKPWLVLAHNPDTVDHVPAGLSKKPLLLCGHTHGGQIDLPWITLKLLKSMSVHGFQEGLYQTDRAQVYVTAGTGMVAWPFRFNMRPSIDILTLT